jgi:hypothetical protein
LPTLFLHPQQQSSDSELLASCFLIYSKVLPVMTPPPPPAAFGLPGYRDLVNLSDGGATVIEGLLLIRREFKKTQ